jgi:hypothetical protein
MKRIGEAESDKCPSCLHTIETSWHMMLGCDNRCEWRNTLYKNIKDTLYINKNPTGSHANPTTRSTRSYQRPKLPNGYDKLRNKLPTSDPSPKPYRMESSHQRSLQPPLDSMSTGTYLSRPSRHQLNQVIRRNMAKTGSKLHLDISLASLAPAQRRSSRKGQATKIKEMYRKTDTPNCSTLRKSRHAPSSGQRHLHYPHRHASHIPNVKTTVIDCFEIGTRRYYRRQIVIKL